MKVLVTGGAGYIGANLCKELVKNENIEKVVVYDSFCRKNYNVLSLMHCQNAEKFKVVNGDILDSENLRIQMEQVDCIVHCAAVSRAAFNEDNPHLFDQVNHWGTANLIRELTSMTQVRKKVIYISSGSVYGRTEEPASEKNEPYPITSYANSKFNGEKHLARLSQYHDTVTLRLGNVFGLGVATRFDSVINKFFLSALFKKPLYVEGSGEQVRPFIYIDSAVEAIAAAVLKKEYCNEKVVNINTQNWSINEIVQGFYEVFPELEVIHVNKDEKLKDLSMDNTLYSKLDCDKTRFSSLVEQVQMMKQYFDVAEANL